MLRITTSASAKAAENYFKEALAKGDYYFDEQEIVGIWGGKGAELLDLSGPLSKEAFIGLLNNRCPDGSKLTERNAPNRRAGYDFTFDVPKSVSILQALKQDPEITSAMQMAAQATMVDIEMEMHARVRKGGAFHDRQTGNMIWGTFTHFTSRPAPAAHGLPKGAPDPQLHMHVYAINATFDEKENQWKAGEFSRIKRDAPYYQAVFHTRLAGELQKLGYDITPTADAFEITGIGREINKRFSRRTAEIEMAAEIMGITDAARKGALGARIRRGKESDVPMSQLRTLWKSVLTPKESSGLDLISRLAAKSKGKLRLADGKAAEEGIDYAISHELERVSETSERRLLATALCRSIGRADVQAVERAYREKQGVLRAEIAGEKRLSTREILAEERELFGLVREGRGSVPALSRGEYRFKNHLFRDPLKDTTEQRQAVRHVMESQDWAVGIVGRAGTGKTTLLKEVREGLKETGHNLVLCAPTAEASRGVLREEGFSRAETVKKLLNDEKLHQALNGGVLWVDEAGMIGNRDLLALMSLAKEKGAQKVVLAGDHRQIRSVPRGDSFRLLEENGLKVVQLENIQRQKNPNLKAAVEAISQGEVGKGFRALEREKAIIEMPEEEKRHKALATTFVRESIGNKPARSLVISPTHKEGEMVTKAIREELKAEGRLKGEEHVVNRHVPTGWTNSEKANAANYEEGQIIQFQKNAPGYRIGKRVQVAGVDTKSAVVKVALDSGKEMYLPLENANWFEVYRPQPLSLMKNDVIRITRNAYLNKGKNTLINGTSHVVEGFGRNGEIRLKGGKVLPRDFGHISHGYCITADAAQAKTVDRVYASIGADSYSATDMRRFYVAMSRARHEARVFTDDKKELLSAVARDEPRRSATEIADLEKRQNHARKISSNNLYEAILGRFVRGIRGRDRPRHRDRVKERMKENTLDVR